MTNMDGGADRSRVATKDGRVPRRRPNKFASQYVSVRQLADELHMAPQLLHYYLKQIGVKTLYVGDPGNAPRFLPADQVVEIVNAIRAYRQRKPVPGLTTGEAARELRISVNTVRALVLRKQLRPRRVRGRLSFSETELARYDRKRGHRVA